MICSGDSLDLEPGILDLRQIAGLFPGMSYPTGKGVTSLLGFSSSRAGVCILGAVLSLFKVESSSRRQRGPLGLSRPPPPLAPPSCLLSLLIYWKFPS